MFKLGIVPCYFSHARALEMAKHHIQHSSAYVACCCSGLRAMQFEARVPRWHFVEHAASGHEITGSDAENGTHRSVAGMRAEKRDLGHQRRCVRSSFLASSWGRPAWRPRCTRVRARRWWTTSSPAEHAGGGGPAALVSVIAGGGGPARARGDGAPRRQSTPATVLGHARRWAGVGAAPASRRGSQRWRGRRVTGAERGRGRGVAGASPPPGEGGAAPPRR